MARFPIGQRIRRHRMDLGVSQSALAAEIKISPAYLNLIEHDKRLIGGALLGRLAARLGVPRSELSGDEEESLVQEVVALARTEDLPGLDEDDAVNMVAHNPGWARALLDLHGKYRSATEQTLALSDRLGQDPSLMALSHAMLTQITAIRSFAEILEAYPDLAPEERLRFSSIIASQSDQLGTDAGSMIEMLSGAADKPQSTSPEKEIDDFIIWNRNHFPVLEDAANTLRLDLAHMDERLGVAIADRLTERHGVTISFGAAAGTYEASPRHLNLDESVPESSRRFRQARHLALVEFDSLLDELTRDDRLTSQDSCDRAKAALASYTAAALLFPYEPFLEAAETDRYDIERLAGRFRGSIEQVSHRLVTLRRPGAEGIPFSFLRTDPAGNISKPFSIPGLRMPRFGGACPLWALYSALAAPERTVAQLASIPEGGRFLFIAKRVDKQLTGFRSPRIVHAIMLGCDAVHASRTVYGDGFSGAADLMATPVGFNCRSCTRPDCGQRAAPAVRREQSLKGAA